MISKALARLKESCAPTQNYEFKLIHLQLHYSPNEKKREKELVLKQSELHVVVLHV